MASFAISITDLNLSYSISFYVADSSSPRGKFRDAENLMPWFGSQRQRAELTAKEDGYVENVDELP